MPNYYVNSTQTKETRHTKYKLCRLLGERAIVARTLRDFRWTRVGVQLEILGHTKSEISEQLKTAKEIIRRCKTQD